MSLIDRINDLPGSSNVGLIVFGHRADKDCRDIEMVILLGPRGAAQAKNRLRCLGPRLYSAYLTAVHSVREAGSRARTFVPGGGDFYIMRTGRIR